MATVYSLVCWGGRTGKTVTLTIASPCVVTSTNHGLRDGTGLVFSTTGALPTGITAGTTYYARYVAANTFHLYDTEAHAKDTASTTGRINTSGSQSGTHIAKSKLMIDYFAQYPGRWGAAGSERCYDGLASFQSARVSNAISTVGDFCELGEEFDEYPTAKFTLNIPAYETIVAPTVNGAWTSAWHGGVYGAGYRFACKPEIYDWGFVASGIYQTLRGFSVILTGNNCQGLSILAVLSTFRDLMIYRLSGSSGQAGIVISGVACSVDNILVAGIQGKGIAFSQYTGSACTVSNCLATKCTTGISASEETSKHSLYNVMSVGNTTNWSGKPTGLTAAANNYGISTDSPWYIGTDTSIKTLTADNTTFLNYAGNDFRPASASAPQVDTATELLRGYATDISNAERPNYNNGGSEAWDGGPFEFNHGYGNHPITATLTLTGLSVGSDVVVRSAGTSTILASVDQVTGSTWEYTYGATHSVDIDVIKPGLVLVPFRNLALTASDSSLPVSQQLDRNYQ